MCECNPVLNPNNKLKGQLKLVLIFIIIGLILSILLLIFIFDNFGLGMIGLIGTLLLFCSYKTYLYVYLVIYIIISLFNSIQLFFLVGLFIQIELQGFKGSRDYFVFGLIIFTFFYYVFSIIFLFGIYKEMKAQLYEGGGASGMLNGNSNESDENDEERNTTRSRLMMGNIVNNQNQNQNTQSNQRNNNTQSGYVPFGGTGRTIG